MDIQYDTRTCKDKLIEDVGIVTAVELPLWQRARYRLVDRPRRKLHQM